MKVRLEIDPINKTHGQFLYKPACPITRALAQSTYRKKNVKYAQIKTLVDEGIKLEYTGANCPPLDLLGAKHLESNEK